MMCHFERIKTLDCYVSCLVANTVTHSRSILVLKKKDTWLRSLLVNLYVLIEWGRGLARLYSVNKHFIIFIISLGIFETFVET